MKTTLNQINDFLDSGKIAFIGVSRQDKEFSRGLFREFLKRGYEAIPVNPYVDRIENIPCFPTISSLNNSPDAALVLTSPKETEQVVTECLDRGISRI